MTLDAVAALRGRLAAAAARRRAIAAQRARLASAPSAACRPRPTRRSAARPDGRPSSIQRRSAALAAREHAPAPRADDERRTARAAGARGRAPSSPTRRVGGRAAWRRRSDRARFAARRDRGTSTSTHSIERMSHGDQGGDEPPAISAVRNQPMRRHRRLRPRRWQATRDVPAAGGRSRRTGAGRARSRAAGPP